MSDDQFRKQMKGKGWTAIPFPSSSFRLLTLVYERKGARGHENVFEMLAPGVEPRLMPPEPITNIPDLSGTATRNRSFDIGLSILSGLIGALGGGTLGLKAGFKQGSELSFVYSGLYGMGINPVALQMHLNQIPAPHSGLLRDWLDDQLFVATKVLLAKKIKVEVKDSSGANLGADVPVIKEAVGGNVKVEADGTSSSLIEFSSDTVGAPIGLFLYAVETQKRGGVKFLDLASTGQGFKVRSFDPDAGTIGDSRAYSDDVEFREEEGATPDTPLPLTLDWEPE